MNRIMLLFGTLSIAFAAAAAAYFGAFSGVETTRCDELAAHPQDLQRVANVKGTPDSEVDVQQALGACLADAENAPQSLTLRFQLGRVLYLAGQEQEAQGVLESAADEGYFAASAYLGELADGLIDALSHHMTAASGGFQPSETRADELDSEVAAIQQTSPIAAAERCDYQASHPDDGERPSGAFGVLDTNMDIETAIDACIDAVRLNPDDPRMKFQLARGLLIAGLEDEGKKYLVQAEEAGHQLSSTYLDSTSLADPSSSFIISCETYAEFHHEGGNLLDVGEANFNIKFVPKSKTATIAYDSIIGIGETPLFRRDKQYRVAEFTDDIISLETENFGPRGQNDSLLIDLDEWSLYHFQSWIHGKNIFGFEYFIKARFYGFCAPES